MDGAIQPWSRRTRNARCLRHSSTSLCDQRFIGRERCIGCVPVSMRSSKTGPRKGGNPGGGPASTSAYLWARAAKSGRSPPSGGNLNAGPSAANAVPDQKLVAVGEGCPDRTRRRRGKREYFPPRPRRRQRPRPRPRRGGAPASTRERGGPETGQHRGQRSPAAREARPTRGA